MISHLFCMATKLLCLECKMLNLQNKEHFYLVLVKEVVLFTEVHNVWESVPFAESFSKGPLREVGGSEVEGPLKEVPL